MAKPKKRLTKRDTLAERVYFIEGTNPLQQVTVRIGRPKRRRNEERYECPAEVSGWGRTVLRPMNGSDAFDALQLALIMIGTELKYITEQTNRTLRWRDSERSDIAFPVYPDFSLKPIMTREKSPR